jgi:ring-1,2-phenylacetyl-CoA epoxidase subunit PaaE
MDTWTLRVVDIQPAAADTKTIFLERTDGQSLSYRAGQFLTLLLSLHGREVRRSYSLSTTPGVDPIAAITVKRVPNGEVSRYLLDHLRTGDELVSLPPAGMFTLEEDGVARSLFFIAAGSGMVPVFSLLKKALAEGAGNRVALLSQHHDEESTLFRHSLTALVEQYGRERFRWANRLSVREGRLNNWPLEDWVEEALAAGSAAGKKSAAAGGHKIDPLALFYLCGPPAFMRMVQFTLKWMGFSDGQIKKENFTIEYVPPAPPFPADTIPRKATIHTGEETYHFEVRWPDTILQAAEKNHIRLPYSCRGGRCSSCVAKRLRGKVKMSINEVLTERDLREGFVLTCVGYAETDVELLF